LLKIRKEVCEKIIKKKIEELQRISVESFVSNPEIKKQVI
jgi:hypothetical protein